MRYPYYTPRFEEASYCTLEAFFKLELKLANRTRDGAVW